MAIPSHRDVCLPLLRRAATQSESGEIRLADAIRHLAKEFQLTKEEKERRGGRTKRLIFYNRIAWARQQLLRAGFIKSTGYGTFMPTEEGKRVLSEVGNDTGSENNSRFIALLLQAKEEKQRQVFPIENVADGEADIADVGSSPDERVRLAYEELKSSFQSDLKDQVFSKEMNYTKFELLILRFLEKIGYGKGAHTGGRGDGGIDGIMIADHLGLRRVFVQVKYYQPKRDKGAANKIGPGAIREFAGSLGQNSTAAQGVFVTSSTFSQAARKAAEDSPYHIVLIDGDRLTELMVKHEVGIRVKEIYTTYDIDNNFWTLDDD